MLGVRRRRWRARWVALGLRAWAFVCVSQSALFGPHRLSCQGLSSGCLGRTDMLGVRRRRWHAGWISVHFEFLLFNSGGNCLIFTVLAAAVPGAVRCCLRAHRHAGCAAATVACTVGSAGPACLGFCVRFSVCSLRSSPSVLPGLVVGVLGAHRHAGCAAATVACRVDLRAQDGIFVFGNRSKATRYSSRVRTDVLRNT